MGVSRREFVRLLGLAGIAGVSPLASAQALIRPVRTLQMQNLHTGERIETVYWEEGQYLSESMDQISHLLRDHRVDEGHPIDPLLLDQLNLLQSVLGTQQPIQVISGYRSPRTNAALMRSGANVAKRSFHMQGRAIDIRLPGYATENLFQASLSLGCGGVGYYPSSDFVHLDTGYRRSWKGS